MKATRKRAPACAFGFAVALRRALCVLPFLALCASAQTDLEDIYRRLGEIKDNTTEIKTNTDEIEGPLHPVIDGVRYSSPAAAIHHDLVDESGTALYNVTAVADEQSALESQYSNILDSASSIGQVSRPSIPELNENDVDLFNFSLDGPHLAFTSDFTILKASEVRDIAAIGGVTITGTPFDVDFGNYGGSDAVASIRDVVHQAWLIFEAIFSIAIVLYWWRQVRNFIYTFMGAPSEEPGGAGSWRRF